MKISLSPVAFVRSERILVSDDNWGDVTSVIQLADHIPTEAIKNIEMFSHLEVIYSFNKADDSKIVFAGHPRENKEYPSMGIFAQRKKDRPNHIGLTTVKLISVNDRELTVQGLDAIDGTPILDIKPVMKEFLPRGEIRQPEWVSRLMENYW